MPGRSKYKVHISKRFHTIENYEKLLRAFVIHGANIRQVAVTAGVTRDTARQVWNIGWDDMPWAKPIYQVLGFGSPATWGIEDKLKGLDAEVFIRALRQEISEYSEDVGQHEPDSASVLLHEAEVVADELMAKAEAALADAEAKKRELEAMQAYTETRINERLAQTDKEVQARMEALEARGQELLKERMAQADADAKAKFAGLLDKARVDAAEVMADEAASTKFGRKAAVGAAAMAAIVLQEAQNMANQVREAMKTLKDLKPREAIRIVRDLVVLAKEAQKVVIYALQAERLRVGKPMDIVGVEFTEQTLAEQEVQVEALRIALEERKETEARARRLAEEALSVEAGPKLASGPAALN